MKILPTKEEKSRFVDSWRLSDTALHVLAAELMQRQPKRILEFGPGLTTVLFQKYRHHDPSVKLRLIDHQSAYVTPEAEVYGLNAEGWYDDPKYDSSFSPAYDLILIDGPIKGRNTVDARTFYTWHSNEKTIFVIDDSNRVEEQQLVKHYSHGRIGVDIVDSVYRHRITTFLFPR